MGRDWIDQGLQQTLAREQQRQLVSERRQHQATIAAKAPELMRQLIAELVAALDEYRQKAPASAADIDVEFELLPQQGFPSPRLVSPRST